MAYYELVKEAWINGHQVAAGTVVSLDDARGEAFVRNGLAKVLADPAAGEAHEDEKPAGKARKAAK